MEKLVCAILIISVLCNVSDGRAVQDPSYEERFDLKNLWGAPFETERKEAKQEKEEIVYGSCDLMSADLWSTLSGSIEFKQKVESSLEMHVNFSGLSAAVPYYKVQVYTSGEIMDGCRNAGEPYITERYNGHLVDIATTNEQGDVTVTMQDVAATLLGDNSIFGRSVHVTSSLAKEPEACCVVVHGYMNNANIESDTDFSDNDLDKIDADNMNIKENVLATDSWPDELRNNAEQTSGQGKILTVETINDIMTSIDNPEVLQVKENHPDEFQKLTGGPEMSDDEVLKINDKDSESKDESTDELSWASFVESVYKEAEKNNIDPNSITKLVDIAESLKTQVSDSEMGENMQGILLDINARERDSLVQKSHELLDMTPNERIDLVDINNNNIESGNSAMDISDSKNTDAENVEPAKWSSIIDKVYVEAKHKGIEPKSITGIKLVDISNSEVPIENMGHENVNSLFTEDNKSGFREGQISELYSNEDPNAADLPIINAINKDPLEPAAINDVAEINKPDNNLINEVLTEAKKQNIDESSIIKIVELPDSGSVVEKTGTGIESTLNSDGDENSFQQEQTADEAMTGLKDDTVDSLDRSENLNTYNNDIVDKQTYEDTKWNKVNTNDIENVRSDQELSAIDTDEGSTEEKSSKIIDQVFKEVKLEGIEPESIIKNVDVSGSKVGSDVMLSNSYLNVEEDAGDIPSVNEIDKKSLETSSERFGIANSENNILRNSFIAEEFNQEMIHNTDEKSVTEIIELPASDTLVENMNTGVNMNSNDISFKKEHVSDDKLSGKIEGAIEDLSNRPDGIEISPDNLPKDTSWEHIIDEVASNLNIQPQSINKVVDMSDSRSDFENDIFENGVYNEINPTGVSSWNQQNNKAYDSADFPTSSEINADVMQSFYDQDDIDVNNDYDKEVNWSNIVNEIVEQTHNKDITPESINKIIDVDKSISDRASAERNVNFNSKRYSNIVSQENEKAVNWPNLVNEVVKHAHNKDITTGSISKNIDLNKWNASSMSVASNINQISPLQTKPLSRKQRFF